MIRLTRRLCTLKKGFTLTKETPDLTTGKAEGIRTSVGHGSNLDLETLISAG